MLKEVFSKVKESRPVVHCITNYVTANVCANTLLFCGASPIMADDPKDSRDITSLASALDLNIGTLQKRKIRAMLASGKTANAQNKPVVLDPVGAGASRFRAKTARKLLKKLSVSIIKGNLSEIEGLFYEKIESRGVDAPLGIRDLKTDALFAEMTAEKYNCVVIITGETDILTDGKRTFFVYNGCPMMQRITGMGCRLSALLAAFAAANKDDFLTSALAALCVMGVCAEKAFSKADCKGACSFDVLFGDALFNLTGEELEECARYEEIIK